jgi:bacillopeptidase F
MTPQLVLGKAVSHAPGLRTYIGQLDGAANFDRPSAMPHGADRKLAVYSELTRVNDNALQGAGPALDALKAQGLLTSYEVHPLSNTVVLDVPENKAGEAWKALNAVPGMGQIVRNREVHLLVADPSQPSTQGVAQPTVQVGDQAVEWNVAKVNAPAVWAQGFKGQGVTVGIVDTGTDLEHPALKHQYRGYDAATGAVSNDYNFFDAFGKSTTPYDDNKHGSHVTGTVLGSTPDHVYGVAPEAKWITSKILNGQGSGTLESVTKGLEWMLAPTDATGKNADPKKAPDLVSNSWGTNNGKLDAFRKIWQSFVAAGIEPIEAAGNAGPGKSTVGAPGSYPEGISVAATDKDDNIASFSSRGPSPIKGDDGSDKKPDIAAPGKDVTSTVPGGGTATFSGTSMATPATSGVVALLLSKYHDLTDAEIATALKQGAKDLGTQGYDYDFGAGRIDAEASLKVADALVAARPKPPAVLAGQGGEPPVA